MVQAQHGDTVRVHYTGTLSDGSIFDSSETIEHDSCGCGCSSSSGGCGTGSDCGCSPLEFTIGGGNVIPGFEKAVVGLSVGQNVIVTIPAEEAYGPRHKEMIAVFDRSDMGGDIQPVEGQQMEVVLEDGSTVPVLITEVTETSVTLDANHPLAGCDLTFDIRLLEIVAS